MTTAMLIDRIEREFRERVSDEVRLIAEGTGRYLVFTPFCFNDGDHLTILLKRDGPRWVLSDEAHTFMRISFDFDFEEQEPYQKFITKTLANFQIEDRDGELVLDLTGKRYGDALYSFIQALLAIAESGKPEGLESPVSHSSALSPTE